MVNYAIDYSRPTHGSIATLTTVADAAVVAVVVAAAAAAAVPSDAALR